MKLHEYQAKEIFARYSIPVQKGAVVRHPEEILGLDLQYPVVLKAQVLVGGRGKAGGIKLAEKPSESVEKARAILGMDIKGERVTRLLVAEAVDIQQEYYLAFTVDRATRCLVVVASASGGIDIEEVARRTPEKIVKEPIDPFLGFRPFHARQIGRRLGFADAHLGAFARIAESLYQLTTDLDAELAEINPLAVAGGQVIAVDAKLIIDDNALYRQKGLPENEELTGLERDARTHDLSYVELDGDIAVIGNGAGLVMSTLDMLDHFGGRPANVLDVGGGASEEAMKQALDIVTRKPGVRALFINIFGGITRCDDIARGLVANLPQVPMSVRLTGTNEEEGRQILQQAGISASVDPEEAAKKAVVLARGQG
ncbi:MAG: ADP-forming succinate--CoA ligase subunit beta [Armatimonadetes bacterium]|nr:ADP-forming succinate--CoA ligase subunit beta [Armatimonadota bacterium]